MKKFALLSLLALCLFGAQVGCTKPAEEAAPATPDTAAPATPAEPAKP